ncbi:hypothetical protein [Streptomyces sp. NPDC047315]|uniref:hypothetical protein n=1 Tax=Streptomyces sp. NPDC047315 TaxID=3155142 RepID=UPI0033F7AE79
MARLRRISEREVSLSDIRWLALIDVDRAALEERWGGPETVRDDFAEWICFAFCSAEGETFFLQREVHQPPVAGFILSVTRERFSPEVADRVVQALDIPDVRIVRINGEATP